MKRNKGWTLAEMMTVVGITGMLAGIAVPGIQQIRRDAKLAEIRTNLKALQDATTAYCTVNQVMPASCNNIAIASLVPRYLSQLPGGTGVNAKDSYSLNGAGVPSYLGTYTVADLYDPVKQAAALSAAGY